MKENMTNDTAKANARRRLVRGVFSAPAAMTLYSGSVAAASVSCVARQLTNPITNGDSPLLVRVRLYREQAGSNSATFVLGSEIGSLTPPGGSYLAKNQVQCVQIAGSGMGFSVSGIYSSSNGKYPKKLQLTSPVEYAAVRVDQEGRIVGVFSIDGPGAGGDTALYVSCWTSFGGLAPFNNDATPSGPTRRAPLA